MLYGKRMSLLLQSTYRIWHYDRNKLFFCCAPTYVGAGVGESMPGYAEKSAKIIRL